MIESFLDALSPGAIPGHLPSGFSSNGLFLVDPTQSLGFQFAIDPQEEGIVRTADSKPEANNQYLASSNSLEMLCGKHRAHTLQ
jgi:hypothetical protein